MTKPITVSLVDDHKLFRKGLAELVGRFDGYTIFSEANDGREFVAQLSVDWHPDVVLLDVQMPVMSGEETAKWLKVHYPHIHVLALSMHDDEANIIRMVRAGVRGYVLKDVDPAELRVALDAVSTGAFYHTSKVSMAMVNALHQIGGKHNMHDVRLTDREREFLKLACTEMTYKQIADTMHCSQRTVDGYREELFSKLQVKSRVGLVMYAVKMGLT